MYRYFKNHVDANTLTLQQKNHSKQNFYRSISFRFSQQLKTENFRME